MSLVDMIRLPTSILALDSTCMPLELIKIKRPLQFSSPPISEASIPVTLLSICESKLGRVTYTLSPSAISNDEKLIIELSVAVILRNLKNFNRRLNSESNWY